jgi:hypothetical protein
MIVSLSEESELERIVQDLQGTDATHGRAGVRRGPHEPALAGGVFGCLQTTFLLSSKTGDASTESLAIQSTKPRRRKLPRVGPPVQAQSHDALIERAP